MSTILRQRTQAKRKNLQCAKLNLVSLMDIFTILVFFLMFNSGDVEVLQSDKSIQLPHSIADRKPDEALQIKISPTDIIVDGRSVAKVDDILNDDVETIAYLEDELNSLASRERIFTSNDNPNRSAIIFGSHDVSYEILKKVMATCANTDYRDLFLAVNNQPDSSTTTQEG